MLALVQVFWNQIKKVDIVIFILYFTSIPSAALSGFCLYVTVIVLWGKQPCSTQENAEPKMHVLLAERNT